MNLETARLVLRPFVAADAVVQHQLWIERDLRVPPYRRISPDGHPTVAELEARIAADELGSFLAVVERATGEMIGYCGLNKSYSVPEGEPELGFEFRRSSWGQGFATEASRALIDWARASGRQRLWATVRDWNTASFRVLEKLGFARTGRVDPDELHGDSVYLALEL